MSDLTRRKIESGDYLLQVDGTDRFRVQKQEDGTWAAALLEGNDHVEMIDTYPRLSDAEEALVALDVEALENGAEPEADEADEQADIPDDAVCWEIPGNPNSKLHRTEDGKTTACSIEVPQDGRSLAAEPTRGKCGVCYR